jgi:hypothetical protein
MALEEYLLSGLSDKDLGRAEGGLASLPGYDTGGPVGSQLFGVDRPSERTTNARYSDVIRKIGEVLKKNWVTDKGGVDFKKFNRFALKHGVDAKDKSRSGKSNLVRFLNSFKKLTGMKYKPVIYDEPGRGTKSFTAESKIKQPPGTRGAPSNKEIYDKGKTLNRTALKKFPNSRADRLKYIVDGLYKTFNRYEGVTKKFLKEFVKKGKFLSPWGMMTGLAMEMMEDPDYMKTVGFGESEPLTYKGGGMADINDMTRPLGYRNGGEFPGNLNKAEIGALLAAGTTREELPGNLNRTELKLLQETKPEVGTFAEQRSLLDKLKSLFRPKQYEGGDDPRYMRFFDKLWKEGYSQKQIDMIWNSGGKINKEDIVPERVEYDFDKEKSFVPEGEFRGAKGGLASISQMTRPVHMAGGGDPELKGLLKALTIQLMLEKGMEGSTLMPSGNPDKIKRLEDKIQAIKIELGE